MLFQHNTSKKNIIISYFCLFPYCKNEIPKNLMDLLNVPK
jgi:hypothetical protein